MRIEIAGVQVAVDLQSVTVAGRRYLVETGADTYGGNKQGIGKNGRTAKYVGGGALLGTIVGASADARAFRGCAGGSAAHVPARAAADGRPPL